LTDLHDALAVEVVGGVPGHKDQQRTRNELNQPHQAQIECAAGQIIDLPAHRDGGNLIGEFRKAAREIEQQEWWMAEQARRFGR
jgi:hypothetical protein